MLIDGILERNRVFVQARQSCPLPPAETMPLVVVACYDPRLDDLLLPSLGLRQGEAFLLRTAGALVLPGGGVMRSLAMAVFMFGATEIVVVGHSSCRMATFKNNEFIETFRRRGVSREAFGSTDLREWAGAIASPSRGVKRSIDSIVGSAFLPHDVVVSGVVLDDTTGALELVTREARASTAAASISTPAETLEPEHDHDHDHEAQAEPAASPAPPVLVADETDQLVQALVGAVRKVEGQAKWRAETQLLRQQLAETRNPLARFRLLESFLRRVAGDSRDVARSLEQLRGAIGHQNAGALPETLGRLLQRLAGGSS